MDLQNSPNNPPNNQTELNSPTWLHTTTQLGLNPDYTGILLVDKPSGITSHDVVARVRKATGIKRVGHAGTLDPLASGLLIVLIGSAYTKQQSTFLKQDKEYVCEARLGVVTDSYDVTGQVMEQAKWEEVAALDRPAVAATLSAFRGLLKQQVPGFSAVKVKGRKLYSLARRARRGETLDPTEKTALASLPVKDVEVFELELTSFERDDQAQQLLVGLRIHCSSGTYIRSLIHDLGQALGVGAIVTKLKRTKIGNLDLTTAISLETVQ